MAPTQTCNKKNLLLLFLCIFSLHTLSLTVGSNSGDWLNHGGDIYNQRHAHGESKISPSTVSNLSLKWEFKTGKDISATPAIFNGTLYFPCWNGFIYAVKAADGSVVWKKDLQKLTGIQYTTVRQRQFQQGRLSDPLRRWPMICSFSAYMGPLLSLPLNVPPGSLPGPPRLIAIPPVLLPCPEHFTRGFYVGISSLEELLSVEKCCTFRGSFAKLDIRTGAVQWQTFMLPDNHGSTGEYSGAAIWGSSPSIDTRRNLVYIATGNLYSAPLRIRQCQEKQDNRTVPTHPDQCIEPDNHSNSMMALDLDSGEIKWYRQLGGYDVWFVACSSGSNPNCPPGPSVDADFGEAPMMLSVHVDGTKRDIVVAVQKSGFAWALDRDNGTIFWSTEAGPGGVGGGGTWGAATDGKRVYTNIVNSDGKNFTLKPSKKNTTVGGWVAMDANTGKILWSTGNPSNATAYGPVTVANGVLFAGSTYRTGPIYAMNAKTGKILWSRETGATVYGGVSVSHGCIYFGNGYRVSLGVTFPSFSGGTSLYAFCVR
ncbi:hypothetical protein TEA_021511 [Camellia sinensis var. sinensis]|uniref:Pyrrolo-quinoline quinone repeat domain-containing protein n=2 Tax=Camellia sinensis TaxID=4442 RepID=A0A4S4DGF4_CAMSN|nr:hypothetical protein TEA_021511 [Camellia sinensis var. sinensis]